MLDPNEEKRINQKNWRMMQKEKKIECIAIKTNLFPPLSDEIEQFCENEHWALSPLIKKCNFKNQKSSKKTKKKTTNGILVQYIILTPKNTYLILSNACCLLKVNLLINSLKKIDKNMFNVLIKGT